jgi:GT2 family glycosyltransferase
LNIIVPVFNRKTITLEFVEKIKKQTYSNFRLFVVDDCSSDGTYEALKLISFSDARVIPLQTTGDCWWAGSVDYGVKTAVKSSHACDAFMFMNDDVDFHERLLYDMVKAYKKLNCTQVVSALRVSKSGNVVPSGSVMLFWPLALTYAPLKGRDYASLGKDLLFRVDFPSASAILFPEHLIRDAGFLNWSALPHYHADGEYFYRASRVGYKCYGYTGAFVIRGGEDSTGLFNSPQAASFSSILFSFVSRKSVNNISDRIAFAELCCPAWCRHSYVIFSVLRSLFSSLFLACVRIYRFSGR